MSKRSGFTLIELLVVILILAVLMAIALPLYLRAVKDSERQTCRSNMQTIANACQAWKVRNPAHTYPSDYATLFTDPVTNSPLTGNSVTDLVSPGPQCPSAKADVIAAADPVGACYSITDNGDGTITVKCASGSDDQDYHNENGSGANGFTMGVDSK